MSEQSKTFADSPVTWGQLVRCNAYLTRNAIAQSERNIELMLREQYMTRSQFEDHRSVRRNRNRIYMLLAGFFMSLLWPDLALHVFHNVALTAWTTAISSTGDITVTLWALWKHI